MIHHLILLQDEQREIHLHQGKVVSGSNKIALDTLASVQCFNASVSWSQSVLEALASQCPVILSRWEKRTGKWATVSFLPRCRYVNPSVLESLCRLPERRATQIASDLLYAKLENQHLLLRIFEPTLSPLPRFKDNSFSRILRLEAKYARIFWAKYFALASQDLFIREKKQATHPLNVALNYGYGFLYHAIEWQCLASGLEPSIGLIHRVRKNRPSLACDLVEPFRCCVELTVMRNLDRIHEKKFMAARFAEMLEEKWMYRNRQFRLRSIIRLTTESFARAIETPAQKYQPFHLHARDACV